ncbi:hypothetical protein TPE_2395 [Treponema pedis str. T A4]|uniref:Uncharacterized protein n=1 Tax=Treponema pedis str. T A4 TaxID=1291379 RepID=S6A932_9SPIR|nr:hypothetical protein TPE_2395 [Treponema pedis str. T A4]
MSPWIQLSGINKFKFNNKFIFNFVKRELFKMLIFLKKDRIVLITDFSVLL